MFTVTLARHAILHLFVICNLCNFDDYLSSDSTYVCLNFVCRTWKEGQFIIIDDSFEHEVWHTGASDRLILIVDFWHPDIDEKMRRTLDPI